MLSLWIRRGAFRLRCAGSGFRKTETRIWKTGGADGALAPAIRNLRRQGGADEALAPGTRAASPPRLLSLVGIKVAVKSLQPPRGGPMAR